MLIFLFLILNSMHSSDEAAKDLISAEISREISALRALLEEEKKKFTDEHEKKFRTAVPQSGQVKYARKRWEESLAKQRKLQQLILYSEVRLESRRAMAPALAAKAIQAGRTWPDQVEYREYLKDRELRSRSKNWLVEERQREEGVFQKKRAPASSGSAH